MPWRILDKIGGLRVREELCVYCRRQPVAPEWRPFCSERCRMADLGRWLSGDYRVAADKPPDEDPEKNDEC